VHLFLSPHLDDAVLSCGGSIFQLTQQGEAVTVLTVMAGDPPDPLPDTPIVRDLHQRWQAGTSPVAHRRKEDIASLDVLAAKSQHRNYPDCVYRAHNHTTLYPSEESLFGDIHAEDKLPDHLAIEAVLIQYVFVNLKTLYVPLGVGHHVDHQIVRDWGIEIYKRHPSVDIRFYEEYPYTRDQGAIDAALDALPDDLPLTAELMFVDKFALAAKIQAIACHRSQLSTFWRDQTEMVRDIQASFCIGEGVYGERYWNLKDK